MWNDISDKKLDKYYSWIVPVILSLIALTVRVWSSKYHTIMVPDYDGLAYIDIAKNAINGRPFTGIGYHPFYSWLIALANLWINDYQWSGMLVSIITGSCTVFIVFLLAKSLFDLRTGLTSAFLLALFSSHVLVSIFLFSEATFILLIYMGLYMGWHTYNKKTWLFGAALGAVMGIAYLTRPEGLLIFIGIVIFLAIAAYSKKELKLALPLLSAWMTFSLIVFPYLNHLKKETGHWTISGKVFTNLPDMKNEQISHRVDFDARKFEHSTTLLDEIIENPKAFAVRYKNNFLITIRAFVDNLGWLILILAFIGFINVLIKGDQSKIFSVSYLSLFFVPVIFTPLLHPLYDRLVLPYTTVFLIFAGGGIVELQENILRMTRNHKFMICDLIKKYNIASLFIALCVSVNLGYILVNDVKSHKEDQASVWFSYRYIGDILRNLSSPGDKIMTRQPLQAFYADRSYIDLPYGNVREIIDYAKRSDASFLVINSAIVKRKRQPLKPLLAPFYTALDRAAMYKELGASEDEMKFIEENLQIVYAIGHEGIIIYKVKQ